MAHVAIAALDYNQFGGPFEPTDSGVIYKFHALFQDTVTNQKVIKGDIRAVVPDGTALSQYRTIIGNAVAAAGAEYGFTIPLTNILLPAFNAAG